MSERIPTFELLLTLMFNKAPADYREEVYEKLEANGWEKMARDHTVWKAYERLHPDEDMLRESLNDMLDVFPDNDSVSVSGYVHTGLSGIFTISVKNNTLTFSKA